MSKKIETEFVISGDAQYKKSVKDINSELSVLRSEMKSVASEFENNKGSVEALTKKGEVLSKQYDAQSQKLNILKAALEASQKSQTEAANNVEKYKRELENAQKALSDFEKTTGGTAEEHEKLQEAVKNAGEKLTAAENATDRAAASCTKYGKDVNYAQAEVYRLQHQIEDNNKELESAQAVSDKAGDAIEDVGNRAEEAGEKGKGFGEKTSEGINVLAGALAAAGIQKTVEQIKDELIECYEAAKQFNSGMAETFTLLPGISEAARAKLTDDIIALKTEYGVAADDVTNALYQAVSAGVDYTESTDALTKANKAAVGGVSNLTTAIDAGTSVVNAYGKENIALEESYDKMFTAVKYGKTTFGELASSMYNVIPIAAANKISFDDVTGALASMTIQGTPTAQSTTQLRQMLVELSDSGTDVSKTFQDISGKSFKEFIKSGGNTADALAILNKQAEKSGLSVNELFGSVEAGNAALALSGANAQRYSDNINYMRESAGACDTAFETMAETSDYSAKKFDAAANTVQIAVGSVLEPSLKNMQDTGTDAMEWAAAFVEDNPWIVGAVTGLATAFGVLTLGVAGYTIATTVAIPVITAFNAALAASPVGWIALGIGAVVAAVVSLSSAFDDSNQPQSEYAQRAQTATEKTEKLDESIKSLNETLKANAENTETAKAYIRTLERLEDQGLENAGVQ
ncbi:MAG: phage tail tape measure protein, partial [Candidatus Riflebacteria bacterium]|nr:phage tail tape measure protein [Candidatus Riflebacteria bacterium]